MVTIPRVKLRFRAQAVHALEQVAFVASLLAAAAAVTPALALPGGGVVLPGVGTLAALAAFYVVLARRWDAEWLVYGAELASVGAYLLYRAAHPLPEAWDALVLVLFCFLAFGLSQALERFRLSFYARPAFYSSLLLPLIPLALWRGWTDEVAMLIVFSTASFYGIVCHQKRWKSLGYAAGVLYNAFLWIWWDHFGWSLANHPQFYLIPVGLSAILFAEVNRRELGRETTNVIRGLGLTTIYLSTAVPMWQFYSLGAWVTLLLLSLLGILAGIGLRVQSFVWLGLTCFLFDVLYQLGHIGMEGALAKWAIMLALGILLVLFVALNEKKRIVATLQEYYAQVRRWE